MATAQIINGLTPPAVAECRVREVYPSVASWPTIARIGRKLTRTVLLAPLGWIAMASVYFGKLKPFLMVRYTLSNRRLMIRHGWSGKVGKEIALADIDDVRITTDDNSTFFRAANLEVIKNGQVAFTLLGVPDPESFKQIILTTRNAWVPEKTKQMPFLAASSAK